MMGNRALIKRLQSQASPPSAGAWKKVSAVSQEERAPTSHCDCWRQPALSAVGHAFLSSINHPVCGICHSSLSRLRQAACSGLNRHQGEGTSGNATEGCKGEEVGVKGSGLFGRASRSAEWGDNGAEEGRLERHHGG